jgi:hypothetical protein
MRPEDVWASYFLLNLGPSKVAARSSGGGAGSGDDVCGDFSSDEAVAGSLSGM